MRELLEEYGAALIVMLSVILSCSLLFVAMQGIRQCMPSYAAVETMQKSDYFLSTDCPYIHLKYTDEIRIHQGDVIELLDFIEIYNQKGEKINHVSVAAIGPGVQGTKFSVSESGRYRIKLVATNENNTCDYTYINIVVEET